MAIHIHSLFASTISAWLNIKKPTDRFFLMGSTLCGFAQTMHALILFRLIQGLGAGAILPIATTIVGDIYSIEERAIIQGYIASVWGITSIIGPALGSVFVQYFHWAVRSITGK